jgi:hypothetical protein
MNARGGQSAKINAQFANPLVATVTDTSGNFLHHTLTTLRSTVEASVGDKLDPNRSKVPKTEERKRSCQKS